MVLLNKIKLVDVCLILFAIMVFLWLEADPSWLKTANDIHDAAWWADPAKQKLIHDNWMNGPFAGALAVGPLSVLLYFFSFKSFGISFFSMRLISFIPAILTGIWLRFNSKEFDGINAATLFLSSTLCFTWARIGLPETGMGLLLLLSVFCLKQGTIKNTVLSSLLLFFAFLMKASFVYQVCIVVPLLIELFTKGNKRLFFLFTGTFAFLLVNYYIFYLSLNSELFAPFLKEFSADYYTIEQLLDPAGLFARIVYLTDREYFKDPSVVLIILALLFKSARGFSPTNRFSYTFLFLFGILFLLPSDFAGRRFVPLFPLLVLAFVEPYSEKPISIYLQLLFTFIFNWISLGILVQGNTWFIFSNNTFEIQFPTYCVAIFQVFVFFFILFYRRKAQVIIFPIYRYSIVILSIAWIALVLKTHFFPDYWISFLGSIGLTLFLQLLYSPVRSIKMQVAFIAFCGIALNCCSFLNLSWSERENAMLFAKKFGQQGSYVAGNSTTFSITLLSNSKAMHYPLSLNWKNPNPQAIAAYTTTDDDSLSLSKQIKEIEQRYFKQRELSCISVNVWQSHQFGVICNPH